MGYLIEREKMNSILQIWGKDNIIYAPKLDEGGGAFADTDLVRYGEISQWEEIVFDQKSKYSFKEVLLPISQTLFFFTEDKVNEADAPKKGAIIFLRSCDLHAVKRLDEIYLKNGFEDYYYKRLREHTKFVLMGCDHSFENCFCVDMGTNKSEDYNCSINVKKGFIEIDNKTTEWEELFQNISVEQKEVKPDYVKKTEERVTISEKLSTELIDSSVWDEYDSRCINCGRCNFVCPTCTCFSMQDIFYTDNGKVGERRRVWASCMVDGFTDMAGGISYRKKNGQRMRFRVLHKVYDYNKRYGYHMCTGCGRCEEICPEYISFIGCINKISKLSEEVSDDAAE